MTAALELPGVPPPRRRRHLAPHAGGARGTPRGYKRHRALGERACGDCRAAWNDYEPPVPQQGDELLQLLDDVDEAGDCPAVDDRGRPCQRWDLPAAHTDQMHQHGRHTWPVVPVAALAAPALKEAAQ